MPRYNPSRNEILKFFAYVFTPIGIMAFVDSEYYQSSYVRPYTLFPSAGKSKEHDIFPENDESRDEWIERMKATAPARKRAKEIYAEMRQEKSKGDDVRSDKS